MQFSRPRAVALAIAASFGCMMIPAMQAQQPTFDAASIKLVNLSSHPNLRDSGGPGTTDPGRIHMVAWGMFWLIMKAYDVEIDQIVGPRWIMENSGPNVYELDATMSPRTTKAQYQMMLQHLLQERFGLRIHREKRNFPGYELVVAGGGSKLKESAPDANAVELDHAHLPQRDAVGLVPLPAGPQLLTSLAWGAIVVQVQQKPLSDFVNVMGRMINQSMGESPNDFLSPKARVVDRTGLTGTHDFHLRFSCELCQFAATNGNAPLPPPPRPADSPGGEPSIFVALQKQLGLKLVKTKDVPVDMIVVDHVEKAPTAN